MQRPAILFENPAFVVINKPAGLLSIPDREGREPSLKDWLREKYGEIFTVHRLDRGTSGLILFARTQEDHKYLSQAFEDRSVGKIYLGIVQGSLSEHKGRIEAALIEHPVKKGMMIVAKKGKPSLTEYEVQEDLGLYSLVRFQIHTGRTHQIRVHMQSIGHPIVCDELYGDARPVFVSSFKRGFHLSRGDEEERPILSRLGLHAHLLEFRDAQGVEYRFEAPIPKDMKALLQQLRKWH